MSAGLKEYDPLLLIPAKKGTIQESVLVLERTKNALLSIKDDFTTETIKKTLMDLATELGVDKRRFFVPVRVAITFRLDSPPLFESMEIIGAEHCWFRVAMAWAVLDDILNPKPEDYCYDHRGVGCC
jgi:glutamyl/glutaminyl-tRNA synthetase